MKFGKWLLIPMLVLVLVLGAALVGCMGEQGPAGPEGPAGPAGAAGVCDTDDCEEAAKDAVEDVVKEAMEDMEAPEASTATAVIVMPGMDCPEPGDYAIVFGSGFPAEERVTAYFLVEGDPELKWFRADTNEAGAFIWCGDLPLEGEFNEDIFVDVDPVDPDENDECPCGPEDMFVLTVGFYVDNTLLATFPMYVFGD